MLRRVIYANIRYSRTVCHFESLQKVRITERCFSCSFNLACAEEEARKKAYIREEVNAESKEHLEFDTRIAE